MTASPEWAKAQLFMNAVITRCRQIDAVMNKTSVCMWMFISITTTTNCFMRGHDYSELYFGRLTQGHRHENNEGKWKVKESEVAQSCVTLCDPTDRSPPGSSVHGILQARILEGVAISFSRGSSRPRDRTQVCHIIGRRVTVWATREDRKENGGK